MQSACGLDGCGGSGEIRTRKTPVVLRRARNGRGGSKGVWAQSVQKRERYRERTRKRHARHVGIVCIVCHKEDRAYMRVAWGSVSVMYTKEGRAGIHARGMWLDQSKEQ